MYSNWGIRANASSLWATPQKFFDKYNYIFNFTLDVAANSDNAKCERFFDEETDGLKQNWGGNRVWCNPPYGRGLKAWIKKCYEESQKPNTLVVALLPVRTDTQWYHDYIDGKAIVKFIRGRLHFNDGKNASTFGNMLVIWGI